MRLSQYCAFFLVFMIYFHANSFGAGEPFPRTDEVEESVNQLLGKMTLEEKVGQMTQVTLEVISKPAVPNSTAHELDPEKVENAIIRHHVGSILNVVSSGFSVEYWHKLITHIQDVALNRTPNHIPVLYGIDAVHGATYTLGATLFPQAIAMAATWNQELLKKEGEITALEVRASGIPWNFSPVLDIGRQPLWSRFWETMGEDVHLASSLGTAYIEGHQGTDIGSPTKAATCLKHFLGYGYPLSGKDRTPAWISERVLREYFLPTFEAGIKAGASSIMVNSSEIDGIPVHSSHYLLTEVLRNELHFKGFTVSDWEDIKRLYTRDKVASSPEMAVQMAVMAGVDMSMVPFDFTFYDILIKLVKDNKVPLSRIDEAVSRILRVKFQVGLFEQAYPRRELREQVATPESTQTNLQSAQEAITLLKNMSNRLPLSKNTSVFITGPTANSLSALNGGWTITWQGDNESLYPKDKMTILQAIQSKVGHENVTYSPGATFQNRLDIPSAVNGAKNADVTIICLGEKPYTETIGNIEDLTLEDAQLSLAEEIIKTGKPVILVLVEGRPRVISRIADGASAIVMGYLPGMEGGRAIADILYGDINPSGKLPFSYPRYPNSIIPYDHKNMEEAEGNFYNPQFPFGFGMSYTHFEYSDLTLSSELIPQGQNIHVSVVVKNTGHRTGKETVQLYLNQSYGSVSRPVRQLKGFTKVELQPGERRQVHFALTPYDLSFIGRDNKRVIESGEFKVMIDKLERKFNVR